MKKLFFIVLSVILAAGFLAACSGGVSSPSGDAAEPEAQKEAEPMDIASIGKADDDVRSDTVEAFLDELTLGSKIAQLLLAVPSEAYSAAELAGIYQSGGVLFPAGMLEGRLRADIINQTEAVEGVHIRPFVAVEEEGGEVSPIGNNLLVSDRPFGKASELYAHGGVYDVETDAREKSSALLELGFNLNLCPVANVVGEDDGLYGRTFKTGPGDTAKGVGAVLAAMNDAGMASAVKYYTIADSDIFLVAARTGAKSIVMAPFEESGVTVHKNRAAYRTLRNGGFEGVIIADLRQDAEMTAEYAAELLGMGCDMMITEDVPQFVSAIGNAVSEGVISQRAVNDAVRRVLLWKYDMGLIEAKGE